MRCLAAAIFSCFLFLSLPALAHPPYLVKQATLQDHDGKAYILETWNGDGVIGPDPYMVQIRDQKGFVVARTKGYRPVFCPSLEWCWALGIYPKRFNADAIRGESKANENTEFQFDKDVKDSEKEEFAEYLSNPDQKRYSGWWVGEPGISPFPGPTEELNAHYEAFYLFPFLLVFTLIWAFVSNPLIYAPAILAALCHKLLARIAKKPPHRKYKALPLIRLLFLFMYSAVFLASIPVYFILWFAVPFFIGSSTHYYYFIIYFAIASLTLKLFDRAETKKETKE